MTSPGGFVQAVVASFAASWLIGIFIKGRNSEPMPRLPDAPVTQLPPPKIQSRWGK